MGSVRRLTPSGCARACLALIASAASESLRLKLAERIAAPSTPQSLCDEIWSCLKEPRWENLSAQIALYLSNRPDQAARLLLEQRLLPGSTAALAGAAGSFPAEDAGRIGVGHGDHGRRESDSDRRAALESRVCRGPQRRLPAIESFDEGAPLILLAGTIPSPPLRTALEHALEMHWGDGPKALEAAGLAGRVLPEPGFLVVVEEKLRRAEKAAKSASRSAAGRDARQRQDQVSTQWNTLGEKVTCAMCQRLPRGGR